MIAKRRPESWSLLHLLEVTMIVSPTFKLADTDHQFTPLGGPIDQDARSNLFTDIGHAIAAQARLEYLVTALTIHVNKSAVSDVLHDPDPADRHRRMLKLLRKWLTQHPEYSPLRLFEDDTFYQGLVESAKFRNKLVHGFLESYRPSRWQLRHAPHQQDRDRFVVGNHHNFLAGSTEFLSKPS